MGDPEDRFSRVQAHMVSPMNVLSGDILCHLEKSHIMHHICMVSLQYFFSSYESISDNVAF